RLPIRFGKEMRERRIFMKREEVLEKMTLFYLEKHDPLQKAKRQGVKRSLNKPKSGQEKGATSNQLKTQKNSDLKKRKPLPSSTKHQIYLKTNGRCAHLNHQGQRCQETRFLDIHHIKPLSQGGSDDPSNLTLL